MKTAQEKKDHVGCGRMGKPVGLKGELKVFWNNGSPPAQVGEEIFIEVEGKLVAQKIAAMREHGRFCVLSIDGVQDRTAAERFKGVEIFLPVDRLAKLEKNEFYSFEVLDMEVFTEEGRHLGKITKIFSAGGSDVYEVKDKEGGEILIPAVDHVIISVDVKNKKMTVKLLEGM